MNKIVSFLFISLCCITLFAQKHIVTINGKGVDNKYLEYRYRNSGSAFANKDIKTFVRKFALEQAMIEEVSKQMMNKSVEHQDRVAQIINREKENLFFNRLSNYIKPLLKENTLSNRKAFVVHQVLIRLDSRSTSIEQNKAIDKLKTIRQLAVDRDSLAFSKLIDEYSYDKNVSVVDESNGLPEVLSALQTMTVGDVSDIIETAEGLHIVRLIGYTYDVCNDFKQMVSSIDAEKLFNTLIVNYTYFENKVNTAEMQNDNHLQEGYIQFGNARYVLSDYALFKQNRTEQESVLWNEFKLKSLLSYIYDQTSSAINQYYERQVSDSILYDTYMNMHGLGENVYDDAELNRFFLKNKKKYKWKKAKKYTALYCANDKKTLKKVKKQVKADLKTGNNFFVDKTYHNYQENYAIIYSLHESNVDFEDIEYKTILNLKERYNYQSLISKQSKYPLSYKDVKNEVMKDYKNTVIGDEESTLLRKYKVEIDNDLLKTLNN